MKKLRYFACLMPLIVGLAACGKAAHISSQETAVVKHDQATAENIVKSCVSKTASQKLTVVEHCIAPKPTFALKRCALSAVGKDSLNRVKLEGDLSTCVVKYR